jgi:hypothetical protein
MLYTVLQRFFESLKTFTKMNKNENDVSDNKLVEPPQEPLISTELSLIKESHLPKKKSDKKKSLHRRKCTIKPSDSLGKQDSTSSTLPSK